MKIRGSRTFPALLLGTIAFFFGVFLNSVFSQAPPAKATHAFQELFDYSLKEKKGITFFVQGQTIPGIVTKLVGEDAIEVRNQTSSRIIIRLDRIDAVATN